MRPDSGAVAPPARRFPASGICTAMRRGRPILVALACAAIAAATAAASVPPPPANGRLSNERTLSRWAYSVGTPWILAQPNAHARRVARMHLWTEDGFPEVYLLLARRGDWVEVRIPMRPNGHVGWVRREALGDFHATTQQLVLNRARLRIYLFDRGRLRWSAPVGIGRPGMPTPAGHFWLRERFKITDPSSGYWPYAFGTADYSVLTDWPGGGVVGIHGPFGPESLIPGRPSHGCIRLRRADDGWLGTHVGIGTPLRII
jgi:hypothetical protein